MIDKTLSRFWLPFLTGLSFAACGGTDGGAEVVGSPTRGGTVVIGVLSDFQAFNPVTNSSIATDEVIKQMLFTPLVRYDEELNVQPYLAESWDLEDEGVTFRLRDDILWHDGRPVTAEDVKFTFDLAKNEATASLLGSAYLNMVESATVIDPRTIRFDFVAPHAQALEDFWWAPLPRHLLQNVTPEQLSQAEFNRNPVGSGPFRFVEWKQGEQLVLEANRDFPDDLVGQGPYVDRVVFRIVPEATTMLTELISGGTDVIGWTLLPDQAQQLEGQRGVELKHHVSREFAYFAWNTQREPFDDARVRRAMAMAINRPEIIQGLLHGYGQPAHGMVPPWSPMYSEIEPLPYDPQQALALLREAGWRDADGNGTLEKDGRPFRFTMLVNASNRLHQDIVTVVQEQLRAVGIDLQIRTMEFQTLLQQFKARDYEAAVANWTLDTFRVDPTPLFSCQEARTPMSANRTGYCDPEVDALIQRGLRATDPAEARGVWAEFSRALQEDQPVTFLFWSEDMAGVGPRLQNVEMDVRSKLAEVEDWWIPEDRQR